MNSQSSILDHIDECEPFMISVCQEDIGRDSGDYTIGGRSISHCPFCGEIVEGYNV